jgi:hypothetical protein
MASWYVCGIPPSPALIEKSTDNTPKCATNQSHQEILQTPKNVEFQRVTLEAPNCKAGLESIF